MKTSFLSPSASTTLIPSCRSSPLSGNVPSYHTISSALPISANSVSSNLAAPSSLTFNDSDLEARVADADNSQRQSNRIFLIAFLMCGGTGFIKWLKDEPGLPPVYALCAVSIPIALVFSGLMFRMCASFTREDIREEREARLQSMEEGAAGREEIIVEDSDSDVRFA